ncbi:unnamed protein product [Urochloa humidicola]
MSRQARKEEAAATQDLLKLDAARMRKATGAQSRKGAVPPMRKAQGGARVSIALKQSSSGWAARAPEQQSSGYGAANPPPRSFTDGSCFFNGTGDGFFSNAGEFSDPATWGNNATPPGGFTNFIQPNLSQQFNFVGESSQSDEELSTPISARDNRYVNIDSGDEVPRTEKRIFWTQEEDVRMMSSWLFNSADSTVGFPDDIYYIYDIYR